MLVIIQIEHVLDYKGIVWQERNTYLHEQNKQ